jgi:hypothetical protein
VSLPEVLEESAWHKSSRTLFKSFRIECFTPHCGHRLRATFLKHSNIRFLLFLVTAFLFFDADYAT